MIYNQRVTWTSFAILGCFPGGSEKTKIVMAMICEALRTKRQSLSTKCHLSVANTEGVGSKLFQNKWNIVLYKAQKKLNFFYFDVSNQCGDKSIMNGVDWVVDRLWILLHHLWNKVLHF